MKMSATIRVEYLPKGSSDYNAVEEYWRQGKGDLLVSNPRFRNLKSAITNYYRTRCFKLDITFILVNPAVPKLLSVSTSKNKC